MKDIPVIFGKKGRTTIPLPLRRRLGWQAGDLLHFSLDGGRVIVTRAHAKAHAANEKQRPQVVVLLIGGDPDG